MASGFFAILDDIAALMDDVAMTSKLATKKTAGILGDDLAVNAEKATGFLASREIPVLWAITKGSFINKLIILPVVFVLNWLYPPAIKAALIIGGVYLAYEGVEKIIEYFFHRAKKGEEVIAKKVSLEENDENSEKAKVSSAIKTDFILSLEIVIIALGTAMEKEHPIITQILSVTFVAIIATVGVYGIVALIVRMDDAGFYLMRKGNEKGFLSSLGGVLIKALPLVIKFLAVVGTIALILVSGGIFLHNIEYIHHLIPHNIPSTVAEFGVGIAFGLVAVLLMTGFKKVRGLVKK
jgi:predicted DNA repair protein MutK